jgi:CubicO group peptidase (beta-lactamase class C family)
MGSRVFPAARSGLPVAFLLSAVLCAPITAQDAFTARIASVDSIFRQFDGTMTPGCAVGVSDAHSIILERAYGMADLEHGVVNTAETIFEPGSVAKQFTAAATILLALDGEISLDDDVRKYIPELPDYGQTITIRHLLHHTSGLRDWGSVAGIEGWPRTTRVHTHTHVLDIASRQMSLNYPPGEYYSYTNTGYNLQAVLVERVSGMSFAEFSKKRIFEPLGMEKTQWRDDFTRIVADRAIAYRSGRDGGWSMLMPFENVHGNGGLLTTVGDLLRFTHNLDTGELRGGPVHRGDAPPGDPQLGADHQLCQRALHRGVQGDPGGTAQRSHRGLSRLPHPLSRPGDRGGGHVQRLQRELRRVGPQRGGPLPR